jgi:hypothetical protein
MPGWRSGKLFLTATCCATVILCARSTAVRAGEPQDIERQRRAFKVYVDGTERGQCVLHIRHRDDGTDWVGGEAGLLFNFIVYKYRFSSSGAGVSKNGKLIEMERTTSFNGTRYNVSALSTPIGLQINVNGRTSLTSPDAWPTSYWQLPARLASDVNADGKAVVPMSGEQSEPSAPQSVSLLDSDKGQKLMGVLQRVGPEDVLIQNQWHHCTRYRLTGDVDVHLWFDSNRRLVRRESIESGHKVLLEIVEITAE